SVFFQMVLTATCTAVRETWGFDLVQEKSAPGLYTAQGRKIASIGVMAKQFFTSSGVALNVSNDLRTFSFINPCGYPGLEMTTIEREGGDPGRTNDYVAQWTRLFVAGLEESGSTAGHTAAQGIPA